LILLQLVSRTFDLHKFAVLLCIIPEEEIWDPGTALSVVFAKNST